MGMTGILLAQQARMLRSTIFNARIATLNK